MPLINWNHWIIKKLRAEDDRNEINHKIIKLNNAAHVIKEFDGISEENINTLNVAIERLSEWRANQSGELSSLNESELKGKFCEISSYANFFNKAKWKTIGFGFLGIGVLTTIGHYLINNFDSSNDTLLPYDAYAKFGIEFLALTFVTWEFTVHAFKGKRDFAQKEGLSNIMAIDVETEIDSRMRFKNK